MNTSSLGFIVLAIVLLVSSTLKADPAEGTLEAQGKADILAATNPETFAELTKVIAVNDLKALDEMIVAGKVLRVTSGTEYRMVESGVLCDAVELRGGPHMGQIVFVGSAFVIKK